MIYLLPVKHDMQFGQNSRAAFLQEFIETIIREKRISLVCEEASQQDLDSPNNKAYVKTVADHYKISHLLCDLTDNERTDAGIFTTQELYDFIQDHKATMQELRLQEKGHAMKQKQDAFEAEEQSYQRKREQAWFDRISDKESETILLVLGAGHISSHPSSGGDGFDKLLEKERWEYEILDNKDLYL